MNLLKGRKGFTLIELLIVITIIGVLAVSLVPRIASAPAKARDAARTADIQQISTGLELYADSSSGLYTPGGDLSECIADTMAGELTTAGVMTTVPSEPQGGCYSYITWNGGENYLLSVEMEVPKAGEGMYTTAPTQPAANTSPSDAFPATACSAGDNTCFYVIAR